jgi:DMSO/TMAO reductase YedYZ molybdopterin-dependent catalytic subunit
MAHQKLRVLEDAPFNAETFAEALDAPITEVGTFFIRNNGIMPPSVDFSGWTLTVDGEVDRPQSFSVDALKANFETVHLTAVLECAGNGRNTVVPKTGGLQWSDGAVGCARWTGVRLGDVLRACGIKRTAVYTAHLSPDIQVENPREPALSRGLPIQKALAPETLLAFAMNGAPLPREHGGPLRIVAPGYPGSAWQKWLARLWVRDREHDGVKMTGHDYRLPDRPLAPGEPTDKVHFSVITDMPVKSVITFPAAGFVIPVNKPVEVRGFAWTGRAAVDSVTVSIDGGASWHDAELEPLTEPFAWRRFRKTLTPTAAGSATFVARARDVEGHVQPLTSPWNPNGYCNNSVHRVSGSVTSA